MTSARTSPKRIRLVSDLNSVPLINNNNNNTNRREQIIFYLSYYILLLRIQYYETDIIRTNLSKIGN